MDRYRSLLVKYEAQRRSRHLDHLDSLMPVRIYETKKRKRSCLGDLRLQSIRKHLDSFGLTRSSMQKSFHESFLRAVCLHLYKDGKSKRTHALGPAPTNTPSDPDIDLSRVMEENEWPGE